MRQKILSLSFFLFLSVTPSLFCDVRCVSSVICPSNVQTEQFVYWAIRENISRILAEILKHKTNEHAVASLRLLLMFAFTSRCLHRTGEPAYVGMLVRVSHDRTSPAFLVDTHVANERRRGNGKERW